MAEWLNVSPDPERAPVIREFVLATVTVSERDELLTEKKIRPEDCEPAFGEEGKGKYDIRYRLEDHPNIAAQAAVYVGGPWISWANEERPRRGSIALYQKLFEVAQFAALGGPEQPIELVWGIGPSRWIKDGILIDLPLIERLVEIEIDERSAGLIRVRPRQANATINLRPYEELKLDGVILAQNAANRALAISAEEDGVSPFLRESFEPILRVCQSQLDAEGRYLPDAESLDPSSELPPATSQLTVSDRWVLFARKRNDSFILKDIENLQNSVELEKDNLPGPARTLVTGPERAAKGEWHPLSDTMGDSVESTDPKEPESPLGELFFPKPFNSEQIEIVRRLEKTDGVVVQGPPGTGKTHTISNIICHYLATGRRVLVVSHGEAALSVLREKLPPEVRDLAISITTSEREGLKQLEGAIRLLQSIVQTLRVGEQSRLIRDVEQSIISLRQRVAAIDAQIEKAACLQLSKVRGRDVLPSQLAKAAVASRDTFGWFTDRPAHFLSETSVTKAEIEQLRRTRILLQKKIEYLGAELPSLSDLPTGALLAQWHEDIKNANAHAARAASSPAFRPRVTTLEGVSIAERAAEMLDCLIDATKQFNIYPWLRSLAGTVISPQHAALTPVLNKFVDDADEIIEDYKRYIQYPVNVPEAASESSEFSSIIIKLAAGQSAFGLFKFSEKKLRPKIEEVRLVGRKPQNAQEWDHVRSYIEWRNRFGELNARWKAIAVELAIQEKTPLDVSEVASLAAALRTIVVVTPRTRLQLEDCLRETLAKAPGALWPDLIRMTELRDCLRDAAASTRLAASRAEVSRIFALFTDNGGKVGKLAKEFLRDFVGKQQVAPDRIEAAWTSVRTALDDIAQHRLHLSSVRELADHIEFAGAPLWAAKLRREPAGERIDPQIPADWSDAWDWGAAESFLSSMNQQEAMRALAEERASLEINIAKEFEGLVRERTFYALAQSMTGPVRAALMMFATSLRRIGGGKGVGAARHRRAARQAMAACYAGVPCWIMPSWRVAEQLPGELGTFDLVIMDEASQSDIKEVTTLLRGKKILVVGDDKQVSPTAAFIDNSKIDRLERTYLIKQPFRTLLLPGSSLYDLAKVMFPDKFVMLREHFRCVEPIIQFSKQFYSEALIPLRVPNAHERLEPPLVDIYVPDGRRSGDKINRREAEVILDEIGHIIQTPELATKGSPECYRSIGVISLIGSKQAALINRMILGEFGEEVVLRHKIACGDSATFQGNERDIVLISMVADPLNRQSQTATHFEQRFNVAMSRARDRVYLIRSVREDELNPKDLKANIIRHMREPMKRRPIPKGDLAALCHSDFEREILRRLLERGYRVIPQVGSLGFSIDLVVEGQTDRRLAIECDGDKYHGPERWADDMNRQRVLERVGWHFWRCWSSSFTMDPEGCMADLFDTLDRRGIQPAPPELQDRKYTEHREAKPSPSRADDDGRPGAKAPSNEGIQIGDRVIVRYLDDNKTTSFVLRSDRNDPVNGIVGAGSPLGSQLIGGHQEDEVEFEANGTVRRVLIVRTEREHAVAT